MAEKNYTCANCNGAITPRINKTTGLPSKAKRKFCSSVCASRYHENINPRRCRPSGSRKPRPVICGHCKKTVMRHVRGSKDAGRFCSRDCAFAHRAKISEERQALKRIAKTNGCSPIGQRKPVTAQPATCRHCGTGFLSTHGRIYCKDACRDEVFAYEWRPSVVSCLTCSVEFKQTRKWQRTCSDKCLLDRHRSLRRTSKARRRARKRNAEHDAIDPIKVFERDKWKCHLCGVATLKSKRGTHDDRAPELEHIVSLANGGDHTWGNVACACRRCNSEKGAASMGQIGFRFAA